MSKFLRNFFTAAALTVAASSALSEGTSNAGTVVATVNGEEITLGQMIMVRATLPGQYDQLPNDVLFKGILDQLIQQTALGQTMEGELPRRVVIALQNEERNLKASEVIEKVVAGAINEAAVKAIYQEEYAKTTQGKEFNASHILVETEDAAKALVQQLDDGADFAELAKEKSTGPSGPSGGQLGWFGQGMMVPSFEEAVKLLEAGQVSKPVQTQFGWHVILLNETRLLDTPSLEDVRGELEDKLREQAVEKRIEEVTVKADIDRSAADTLDPELLAEIGLLED